LYRILIAEDEKLEREALKFIINKGLDFPIEIQEAENGREAIVKSRTFKPDIIFMDIKMPGIDGIEAAKSIKEESSMVQLVFLTAFNRFEYARDALHLGASDFLVKPSPEKSILEITEKLILKVDTLRQEMNSRKNNELKLTRASGYLENEFVYTMAVRGISSEKFFDYISILDLSFKAGRGGIMKIFYDSYPLQVESDYQKSVLKKRCSMILKNRMMAMGYQVLTNMELSSVYFFIIPAPESTEENIIYPLLSDLEKEIEKELSIKVKIGAGHIFTSPEESLSSFSRASRLLGQSGKSDQPDNDIENSAGYPMELEIMIEKAILKGDRELTEELFEKISNWYNFSSEPFDQKKQFLLELATVLKHSAACLNPNGTVSVNDSELKAAQSPGNILSNFRIFLNDLLEHLARIKESDNDPAVDMACRYIEDNFFKDISLEDAADYCGLSSFYFSKLFKKRKKITFIEYLTKRRIHEAQKLLEENELSIKEISCRIGYNDPNYFTRVFKRVEKISPTTFRNNKIQNRQ